MNQAMNQATRIASTDFQRDTHVLLNERNWRLIQFGNTQPGAYLALNDSELGKLGGSILIAPKVAARNPETHAFIDGFGWQAKGEFNPTDIADAEFYLGKISVALFPDMDTLNELKEKKEAQRKMLLAKAERDFIGVMWRFFDSPSPKTPIDVLNTPSIPQASQNAPEALHPLESQVPTSESQETPATQPPEALAPNEPQPLLPARNPNARRP